MAPALVESIHRALSYLEQPELTRLLGIFIARALSIRFVNKQYEQLIYGQKELDNDTKKESLPLETFFIDSNGHNDPSDCDQLQASAGTQNYRNKVLAIIRNIDHLRIFTTLLMIYITIRFYFLDVHPVNCYLPGRLIGYEPLSKVIEMLMIAAHLSWRLVQFINGGYHLSLLEFILLSEREMDAINSNLSQRSTLQLAVGDFNRLKPRFRHILEVMCFRVAHETKFIFKLRPTRSQSARSNLGRRFARTAVSICSIFSSITLVLTMVLVTYTLEDENYIAMYPGCDPELEQAFRSQSYATGLNRFKLHRICALILTPIESWVIYMDGGVVVYLAMTALVFLYLDLIALWSDIDGQIHSLQARLSNERGSRAIALERRLLIDHFERDLEELLAAISDFFQLVAEADKLVAKFIAGMMLGMLVTCAVLSYYIHIWNIRQVPTSVALIAALIMLWFLTASFGFIVVNVHCERSYTKLCSLFARTAKHGRKHTALLEYYEKRRSCFTLMEEVPFRPTTFLTMFGWTFSCFCIITGMLRDNGKMSRVHTSAKFRG